MKIFPVILTSSNLPGLVPNVIVSVRVMSEKNLTNSPQHTLSLILKPLSLICGDEYNEYSWTRLSLESRILACFQPVLSNLRANNEYLTDSGVFVTSPIGVAEIPNALNEVIRMSLIASAAHSTFLGLKFKNQA